MALGASVGPSGVRFAVHSGTAEQVWLCLFDEGDRETDRITLSRDEDGVWSGAADGLGAGARYGYRADGRYDPLQGYHFDPHKLLVDPYATRIDRVFRLVPELSAGREESVDTASFVPKAVVEGAWAPVAGAARERPGLIYELNVRPFTMRHPKVPERLRGTIKALGEPAVIEHLISIGVDVVELMPIAAWMDDQHLPALGLTNVWGYNPITYFAPDPRLLAEGPDEIAALVGRYAQAGIGVVLDVVYNHTGESDLLGPVVSMKGLDALTYYRHVERDGQLHLVNDAGTGNTLDCTNPVVQDLVIDSLRHWVTRYGIAGFRFDLATILGRDERGFSSRAAMLERVRTDPVLSQCLLIAEPWDPAPGGYQVGRFGEPFLEWNDKYRDDVRRFWKGESWTVGALATRLAGSADLFGHDGRRPSASVNFIAAHDGFTLADLVSHAYKHNAANGEGNRDGHDGSHSWNNGVEGETGDAAVIAARSRDVRALLATLFVSLGTPMLTAGDEMGRSQKGNNNAYAQDNETTWLDWARADEELVAFVARLTALRRTHPALRRDAFLTERDVVWLHPEGRQMTVGDWEAAEAGILGMLLRGADESLLVWFNRRHDAVAVDMASENVVDILLCSDPTANVKQQESGSLLVPPRSVLVLSLAE